MRSYLSHTVHVGGTEVLAHRPHEYLALVDLESYPAFVGQEADRLDMMVHFAGQMRALTAMSWDAPDREVTLRFFLTEDDAATDRLALTRATTAASGWIRTQGTLCLTSRDRLYDCAHDRTHDLLHKEHLPKTERPHVLNVPAGLYGVLVHHHFIQPGENGIPIFTRPALDYTIILHHYPFPAPRVAPVRLPGLFRQAA